MLPEQTIAFDVLCMHSAPAQTAIRWLENENFYFDSQAQLKLIIDVERGFAQRTLRAPDASQYSTVIVTYSFCPEYWEDLWDLRPTVLVVDQAYEHAFADPLRRAARGEHYRSTPDTASRLTRAQRDVLQRVARGCTNGQIAAELSLEEKSVLNMLTGIYKRLGVKNRTEASLYYWGVGLADGHC